MQAGILIAVYVATTIAVQFAGFLINLIIQYAFPKAGLMSFLIMFMGAFGVAWPIAVRLTEWGLKRAGIPIEQADKRAA